MKTFRITNITNLLGKRSFKQNSELEVEYVDGMIKKTLKIKPQETIYLSLSSLPLSIHRLRIKGLVTVSEVSAKELKAVMAANKRKDIETNAEEKPKNTGKKITKTKKEDVELKESKTKEEPKVDEKSVDNSNEKKSTKRTTKKSDSSNAEEKEETKD